MKKILLTLILLLTFPLATQAQVLYEHREQKYLAKDILYEQNRQMTTDGMLDINIILVPLDNPGLYIGPVASQKALGLKESTTNILSGTDAIAGVNGDFFGMAGTHSVPIGTVAADGKLQAASVSTNAKKNEFATFFLGEGNVPFMQYIKMDIKFFNNGKENIELGIYNKIGANIDWPVLVDRQIMDDTAAIDARFPGLTKLVVENGQISYISRWGETITIPEGGYIIVIPGHLMEKHRPYFKVGDTAQLSITNNVNIDLNRLRSAIGGGGLILSGGQLVKDSGIAIANRQPRTAIGVSADKKQLILMTVDGRSHSIGATHAEMAALLTRYGAYDAMHLDGGGSTTMVVKDSHSNRFTVANTPSDSAQRRIINALGVFDRTPLGDMTGIELNLTQQHVFVGTPVWAEAYGQDSRSRHIALPEDALVLYYSEPAEVGAWSGNLYVPSHTGTHTLQAVYGGYNAWQYLYVHEIAELMCKPASIRTAEGMVTELSFTGLSTEGIESPVDKGVLVRVVPAELGVVADGQFTAYRMGSGYLECSVNGVYTYVPITVGGNGQALTAFNTGLFPAGGGPIKFSGTPANVSGWIMPETVGAQSITGLTYNFEPSHETQAAYINFEPALALPNNPIALRFNVMGDGSGHWLRGQVTDGAGKEHTIDFERSVDSMEWRTVTAILPDVSGPITLKRIYMVETSAMEKAQHKAYFTGLEVLYPPAAMMETPAKTQTFTDPQRMSDGASGATLSVPANISGYSSQKQGSAAVVTLSANKGGLYATDKQQWAKFMPETGALMSDFIVVVLDVNPLKFSQAKESELLHKALTTQQKMGKPVYVVSAAGTETTLTMKDGIRYIDLKRGTGNIKFWVDGKEVKWGV